MESSFFWEKNSAVFQIDLTELPSRSFMSSNLSVF